MATKQFKSNKIEEFKKDISEAKVALVVDYRKFSVAEITELRRTLQKENSDITVIKNTLAKIALKDTVFQGIVEHLQGPTAIALGFGDEVSPAKVVTQFVKKAKKGEVRGGCLENNPLNAKEVQRLAELPSKEELYAKMLGSINSPASGLVNTVNGVARALVIAMDGVRKQKETSQA